jgi:small subunit ribosomal protein S5
MVRATIDGLGSESSPRMVAQRRGKKVSEILQSPVKTIKAEVSAEV